MLIVQPCSSYDHAHHTTMLTLEHLNKDVSLVVSIGGEGLRLGRDSGVMLDKSGHDTSSSLDTKGQRGNVKEEQVLSLL